MAVGPWQLIIIALIILLLFGASRLSDIGKGLGEGIRNFKRGVADDGDGDGDGKEPKQLSAPDKAGNPAEDRTDRKV